MSDDIREGALAELAEFEAAVFRFGHQVRAFLAAFPEDMPAPSRVLPRFLNGSTVGGELFPGGESYVHLVGLTEAEVHAWASLLQTQAERKVDVEPEYVSVSVRAEGDWNGLRLYAGSTESYSPAQWEQLQKDGTESGSDAG